jgi:hypothetical protein
MMSLIEEKLKFKLKKTVQLHGEKETFGSPLWVRC